ncbi:MFS transporter [Terricaulis silvestris]|uniref:Enterobactin exporter EntS n=1 Tax=Terricaulis silvestris TaxID=2686094 RepID=A0A6I6MUR2_9CAUL|nr:MFS transporter [Terricaulis silvestris]QGZ96194.1 enterobactin exporter EntS [Terricaulis silvestris]
MTSAVEQLQSGFDSWRATTLKPLRFPVFRALWLATMAAYFGAVIQTVGAAWHMTSMGVSADWVAYVQAASLLPTVLLALPAGALADTGDRRVLMLIAQIFGAAASVLLVATALFSAIGPVVLLVFTLLIGCAAALAQPAWQAAVGDLVERDDLPAAIGLNALAFNAARSLGPAIGGAIVALVGAVGAFAVNAFSYLALIGVLAGWKAPKPADTLPPEPIGRAIMSGIRYALLSPALLSLFARGALFGLCASSVLALLPLVARDKLDGGPLTYGVLLGGFGLGSMAAALFTARTRQWMSSQRLVGACTLAYGVMAIFLTLSPFVALSMAILAVAGAAWILALATISTCVQMSCPRWVVGRCVAMGQVATLGGLTAGAIVWGTIATHADLEPALIASGLALLATLLLAGALPIPNTDALDWSVGAPYPIARPGVTIDPRSGPIIVTIEYRIARDSADAFLRAIHEVGRIRQRDGARRWSIAQDLDDPEIWRERYQSPTWTEHLRRVSRVTAADQALRESVLQFHEGPPPAIKRMLERPPGATPIAEQ